MTEQLEVRRDHRVLEIGTGSGYQAAVLSRLAREVVSDRALPHAGRTARGRGSRRSATTMSRCCSATALAASRCARRYDRIIVTAAAETIPPALIEQLADGGIMILPLGPHDGAQELVKLTKTGQGLARENLIAVRFVPLLAGRRANCDGCGNGGNLPEFRAAFRLGLKESFMLKRLFTRALLTPLLSCCV